MWASEYHSCSDSSRSHVESIENSQLTIWWNDYSVNNIHLNITGLKTVLDSSKHSWEVLRRWDEIIFSSMHSISPSIRWTFSIIHVAKLCLKNSLMYLVLRSSISTLRDRVYQNNSVELALTEQRTILLSLVAFIFTAFKEKDRNQAGA